MIETESTQTALENQALDALSFARADEASLEPTLTEVQQTVPLTTDDLPRVASKYRFWAIRGSVVALALLLVGLGGFAGKKAMDYRRNVAKQGSVATNYATSSSPLNDLANQAASGLSVVTNSSARLTVNGTLNINGSMIINQSGKPTNPVKGQIYYSKTDNKLWFYDGTRFIDITYASTVPASVSTVQGLTGAVTFTGGRGISVSGTTISSTGVTSLLSGSSNLVIGSDGNGGYTVTDNTAGHLVNLQDTSPGSAQTGNINISGTVIAASFAGDGSALTNLNANNIATGTLADGRLSTNVALLNGSQTFSGANTFTQPISANTITPTSALTVGATGQSFTIQGNGASTITSTTSGLTTTIGFVGTPVGAVTYNFDNTVAGGTYTICTTVGNCAGTGSGVTTPGGTPNKLARFVGSQSIGDSAISDNGATVTIQNAADSTNAFQIQNLAGTSNLFVADTTNTRIGIGTATPGYTLDVNGDINIAAGSSYRIGGTALCVTAGCTPASGSAFYIQNGTAQQTSANFNIVSAATNAVGGIIKGASGQTVDLFQLQQDATTVARFSRFGDLVLVGDLIAANVSGNGSGLTNLNATSITTGTLADARLSTNVTLMGNTFNGANQLVKNNGSGDLPALSAINLTNLNASAVTAGTLPDAHLSVNVTLMGNTFNGANQLLQLTNLGYLPVLNGSNLTSLNGSSISSGTVADARLSANVALLNGNQTFSGSNTFSSAINANTITPSGAFTAGATGQSFTLQGNGSSTITSTKSGQTTTVGFAGTPVGTVAYNFDNSVAAGTYTICTTVGNCAGTGGGVTTPGGTLNKLARFSGAQTIADSAISDNGATVTVQNASNSTNAFQIQNSAGTSNLFVADTTNTRIGIGMTSPAYTLDVNGDINSATGLRVNGVLVCTASGCASSGSSGFYIQNGTTQQNAANFNIQSAAAGSIGGVIKGAVGQTADLFDLVQGATTVVKFTPTGNVDITGLYKVNGTQIASTDLGDNSNLAHLNGNQTFSGNNTFTGTVLNQNASNSTAAFQIQNAAGTSNLFIADTTNTRIGIGTNTPGYTLDVNGDINIATGNSYRINGVAICGAAANCAPASGSSFYIQNSTSQQTNANFNIQSANSASVGGIIRGAAGQTADLFRLQDASGANVATFTSNGNLFLGQNGAATGAISFRYSSAVGDISLVPANPGVSSYSLTLPAENGTLCSTGSICAGYAASAGSNNYIQNGTSLQTAANFNIQSAAAGSVVAVLRAAASQTADLLQFQNQSGVVIAGVDKSGSAWFGGTASPGGRLGVTPDTAGTLGLVIRGRASQTANLQEWQDSTGAILASLQANGRLSIGGTGQAVLAPQNAGSLYLRANTGVIAIGDAGTTGVQIVANGGTLRVNTATTADATALSLFATGGTANKGLVIQGVAGQTANLQEWQASDGQILARINQLGNMVIGTNTAGSANQSGTLTLQGYYSGGATATSLVFNPGGSNALISNTGSNSIDIKPTLSFRVLNGFDANAPFFVQARSGAWSTGQVLITSQNAGTPGLAVQGAASQTANLQQWQDSNGAVLSKIGATGGITTSGVTNTFGNLAVPTFSTASTGTSFYYVITATNAAGETVASTSLGMANNTSALAWTQIAGATGYKIYRNTSNVFTSGSLLLTTITNGTTVAYTDTGTATGVGLPPTAPVGTKLVVQSWTSQSANLQEWQTSTGAVGSSIDANGSFKGMVTDNASAGGTNVYLNATGATSAYTARFKATADGNVAQVLKANSATQSGDLLQLQSSANVVLSGFNATGGLFLGKASTSTGSAQFFNAAGAGSISLQALDPGASSYTLSLPAETGTLCSTGSVCAGYAASSGSGSYIQNGTTLQTTANFNIQSAAAGSVGGVIRGAASQTADLQQWQDSAGVAQARINAGGTQFYLGTNLMLERAGTETRIWAESGRSLNFFADAGSRLTISSSRTAFLSGTPVYINSAAANTAGTVEKFRVNTPTTVDNLAATILSTGAATSKGLVIQGAASQSAALFEAQNSSGTALFSIYYEGTLKTQGNGFQFWKDSTPTKAANVGLAVPGSANSDNLVLSTYSGGSWSERARIENATGALLVANTGAAGTVQKFGVNAPTTADNLAASILSTGGAANKGLVVQGAASQTADLLQLQRSDGTAALAVSKTGLISSTYVASNTFGQLIPTGNGMSAIWGNYSAGADYQDRLVVSANWYKNDAGTDVVVAARPTAAILLGGNNNTYNPFLIRVGSTAGAVPNIDALAIGMNGYVGINNGTSTVAPTNRLGVNTPTTADSLGQLMVSTNATTNKGIIVQGVASQSANLQEWQSSAGTVLNRIASTGAMQLGFNIALQGEHSSNGTFVDLIKRGPSNNVWVGNSTSDTEINTANNMLFDVAGTQKMALTASALAPVASSGLLFGTPSLPWSTGYFKPSGSSVKGLVVTGAASQSANLQQWENSSNTVLSSVDANGLFNIGTASSLNAANSKAYISGTTIHATTATADNWTLNGVTRGTQFFTSEPTVSGSPGSISVSGSGYNGGTIATLGTFGYMGSYSGAWGSGSRTIIGANNEARSTSTISGDNIYGTRSVISFDNDASGGGGTGYALYGSATTNTATGGTRLGYGVYGVGNGGGANTTVYGGFFTTTGANGTNVALQATTGNLGAKGLVVKGVTGQTANLQEWQDNSGTVLGKVTAAGSLQVYASGNNPAIYGNSTSDNGIEAHSSSNLASKASIVAQPLAADSRGIIIKGAASQTANLQEWQDSTGAILAYASNVGRLKVASGGSAGLLVGTTAGLTTSADGGNLNINNSSLGQYIFINPSATGNIYLGSTTDTATIEARRQINISSTADAVKLQIQGAASQTANLQEWQNNSGTVLTRVDAAGRLGIGVTPTYSLDVSSVVSASNTTGARIVLGNATTGSQTDYGLYVDNQHVTDNGTHYGVYGLATGAPASGISVGVYGKGTGAQTNYGLYGIADGNATANRTQTGVFGSAGFNTSSNSILTGGYFELTRINNAAASSVITGNYNVASATAADYLLNLRNNGSNVLVVNALGGTGINTSTLGTVQKLGVNNYTTADNAANVILATSATTSKGLVIQGVASQSANLQEWQSSTGTVLASIGSGGALTLSSGVAFSMLNATATLTASNLQLTSGSILMGATPAAAGAIRLTNATTISWRNAANTADKFIRLNSTDALDLPGVLVVGGSDSTAGAACFFSCGVAAGRTGDSGFYVTTGTATFEILKGSKNSAVGIGAASNFTNGTVEKLRVGTVTTVDNAAFATFGATAAGNKALVIQGAASQSASLQEWQNSAGSALAAINSAGEVVTTAIRSNDGNANKYISANGNAFAYSTFGSHTFSLWNGSTYAAQFTLSNTTQSALLSTNAAGLKGLVIKGVASQTANLQEWQDSTGAILGSLSATGDLTVKSGTFNGTLTVNGHIISGNTSGTTTAAAGAGAGTGASASVSGNDTAGVVTVNTGTGAAAGIQATVTFANAYGAAPKVVITPKDVPGGGIFPQYQYDSATGTFDLKTFNALTDSSTYTFSYQIIQ